MAVSWSRLVELGRNLPEVEEVVWRRTLAPKVRAKSFVRLKEDGRTMVFIVDEVEEQELLTTAQSDGYFITDHYRGYPAVLARLSALTIGETRLRLEKGWRNKGPRKPVDAHDAEGLRPRRRPKPR